MATVYVWPGVTGRVSASPAWSGRRSGTVADSYPWGRLSGLAYTLDPFSLYPALSPPSPTYFLPSPHFPLCFCFYFYHPLQWSAGALGEMPDGDQVDGIGLYTLQPEETPTGSDEGASGLGPAVVGNTADGGGANGGHLGRGKLENP